MDDASVLTENVQEKRDWKKGILERCACSFERPLLGERFVLDRYPVNCAQ